MKPLISNPFRSHASVTAAVSVALFSHFAAPSAFADTYYWDNNTTTAGFGTAGGTWNSAGSTLWNNDSTGGGAGTPNILGTSITTATTDILNFGTATAGAGLGTGAITVSGSVDSGNMNFGSASGDITFNNGTINLAASAQIAVNGSTDTVTIASVLSGATTALTKSGGGTLSIKGANSAITGGEIRITNGEVICANGASATGPNTLGGADGWTVVLGNSSGTVPATLSVGNSFSLPNPITVRTGSSGAKTLATTAGTITVTFSGIITANDDLTILQNIAGTTGNLTVNNSGNTVASGKTVTFSNNIGASLTDSSTWGGDGMLEYSGSGNGALTVSGAKTHSGGSTLGTRTGGTVVIGTSSTGPANAPTSGPFGRGTLTIGATRLVSTGADRTIANAITFSGNPTFPTVASEKSFIFSGDASLGATRTLTVETGSTEAGKFVEFQGTISGAFGLTKSGTGLLTLSGANTYSGATTISAGKIVMTNAAALQNSAYNTTGSNGTTIGLDVTGGLNSGTLALGGLSGAVDLASAFTAGYAAVTNLTLNPGSGSNTYSGVIANGAAGMTLTKTGAGSQILSGVNTYTGATTISEGTLILNNATALGTTPGVDGTSSISMAAGTSLRSNFIIADAGNEDSFVHAPITLSGTGGVNFLIGAGSATNPPEAVTFNLNGAIGGTAGTNVEFSTAGGLNNPDSTFVLGAAFTYDGNTTITVGNSSERINVKSGVANALPSTTVLTLGNTVGSGSFRVTQFDLNGNDQTLAGLSNGGTVPSFRRQIVTNSNGTQATLTIDNSADFTFGGATTDTNATGTATTRAQITGNLALVKRGAGTLTLGGTLTGGATPGGNTYTGTTTINGGTLRIDSLDTGATGAVTVGGASATGSPTLAGTGTVGGNVTIAAPGGGAAGTLAPGSGGIGTLVINNKPLTFESGSTAGFEVDADTIANRDQVTGISALTYGGKLHVTATGTLSAGDTWDLFDFTSQSGAFDNNNSFGTDGSSDPDLPDLGAGLTWQFDYATGTLSVGGAGGSGYDTWSGPSGYNLTGDDALRTSDPDGDGFTNIQEFLFGSSPIASNGSLSTTEKSGTELIIRWQERTGGATYTLRESATLDNDWANSSAVPENDGSAVGDYQPRKATVTIGSGKLFFHVRGVEN